MHVIRPGRLVTGLYRGECERCHCIVEVAEAEIKRMGDHHGGSDKYVMCPTVGCGEMLFVKPISDGRAAEDKT